MDDQVTVSKTELEQLRKAAKLLAFLDNEFLRTIVEYQRPRGGQHVTPSGLDFWPVGAGVVRKMEWWRREMASALKYSFAEEVP